MVVAVTVAVASWLLADVIGGPVPLYVFGGAALVSAFCSLSGALMDGERERLKRSIAT